MSHPPPRRIFITVAEVSGDQHAAHLIRSLKQLDPSLVVEGLGGAEMRAAGATIHHETVKSAAMGITALRRVGEVMRLLKWTRKHFQQHRPDLHICCDSWGMNKYFARAAHETGVPVLYYIAPQVWASREGRVKMIRQWVDQLACILPFEEAYFKDRGVNARFVGHPLFDQLTQRPRRRAADNFQSRPPVVGLCPGSRRQEAAKNLPSMLEVARQIRAEFPGTRFLIPTTAATDPIARDLVADLPGCECQLSAFDEVVQKCDLCLTVSGTATLQLAGDLVPMVVVYRASRLLWHLIGRWMIRTRTYALVNLLSDRHCHIVPEFIPWFGSTVPVANKMIDLLRHPETRNAQLDELQKLVGSLDQPGASMNVAKLALEMVNPSPAATDR